MTLPPRLTTPDIPKMLMVYGAYGGELPGEIFQHLPAALFPHIELVSQRRYVNEFPLGPEERSRAEAHAAMLLQHYRADATLVITPLLHVASPCIAMGIPVVLVRKKYSPRFSYLKTRIDLHLSPDLAGIDWSGSVPDLSEITSRWTQHFCRSVNRLSLEQYGKENKLRSLAGV